MSISADWIKQTVSGTPGTGAITLSTAKTGYIRLQDASQVTDGALVYYSIEDGLNRERGIGTYSTTGPTLTRTVIQAKIESGTYTENPGTGLTLTSAAIVACSPVSRQLNHNGALVFHSTTQSIASGSYVAAVFDSETYDTLDFHDNVTNNSRLTVPAGVTKVRLVGNHTVSANATGKRGIRFYKNGASVAGGGSILIPAPASGSLELQVKTATLEVVTGDYFELMVYQDSGGALSIGTGGVSSQYTFASIEVIE